MKKFFSSIRLEEGPGHDRLGFWQAGAKNGELVLTKDTGMYLFKIMTDHADTAIIRQVLDDE